MSGTYGVYFIELMVSAAGNLKGKPEIRAVASVRQVSVWTTRNDEFNDL